MTNDPQTTQLDISRNAVIGLAELHENMAAQAELSDERRFYQDTADALRALVNQRDYPNGET